jgi:hypothetical protein
MRTGFRLWIGRPTETPIETLSDRNIIRATYPAENLPILRLVHPGF